MFTDTNTNLTIILTQDIVGVNRAFAVFCVFKSLTIIFVANLPCEEHFSSIRKNQCFFLYSINSIKQTNVTEFPNTGNTISNNE